MKGLHYFVFVAVSFLPRISTHECKIEYGKEANTADGGCETYWECEDYVGVAIKCPDQGQFDFRLKECRPNGDVWCQWQHLQLEEKLTEDISEKEKRKELTRPKIIRHVHHPLQKDKVLKPAVHDRTLKGDHHHQQQNGKDSNRAHITHDSKGNAHIHLIPTQVIKGDGTVYRNDDNNNNYYYYTESSSSNAKGQNGYDYGDSNYNYDTKDYTVNNNNNNNNYYDTSGSHGNKGTVYYYYYEDTDDTKKKETGAGPRNAKGEDDYDFDFDSFDEDGDGDDDDEKEEYDDGFYDDLEKWGYVCQSKYGHEPNLDDSHCRSFWRCDRYKGSLIDCKPGLLYDYHAKACRNRRHVRCHGQHDKHIHDQPKHRTEVEKKDGGVTIVHHYYQEKK